MKILIIFGTRPEAIKMAPLVLKLRQELDIKVCVTGQHREMLDQVLETVPNHVPDYDLNLMKPNQNLANLTADRSLMVSHKFYRIEEFDWVLVQGDTTSTIAGAMAAFYQKVRSWIMWKQGYVLITWNSPFPEELNRQVTSKMARLHFAPTMQRTNKIY